MMNYRFTKSIWWKETLLLLQLAIPNVILQLGLMVPYFVAASYIGRNFGAIHLSGFQLANLTANLFTLSLVYGLNSACDTLAPQAFGAGNFKQVGVVAIRGFIGNMLIILPICLLSIFYIKDMLIFFGQDEVASEKAETWYSVYVTCFPCYALFMVTYKFLSAQNVMFPLVLTSILDFTIVLPLATTFWTSHFGFAGSAAAVSTYICGQAIILLLYLYIKRPYMTECWPGIMEGFKEAVNSCEAIKVFVILGAGGIVASSEWIYWETLSLGVGTLGVVPLSVHTVPTQVVTLAFMIPNSVAVALAVRMGVLLPQNVHLAKQVVVWTFVAGIVLIGFMSLSMYIFRTFIFQIFINADEEEEVLEGCERIWLKVCLCFFQFSIFGLNVGISTGLGMQWTLGLMTLVFLWLLGLPAAWYYGIILHESIDVVWSWLIPPYVFINIILLIAFVGNDWNKTSKEIRVREGMDEYETLILSPEQRRSLSLYGAVDSAHVR